MSESDFELVEGSGNVFRDLGDPDADLKQAKAILAAHIIAVLDDRGLSVRKAGALTRFAYEGFSGRSQSRVRPGNRGPPFGPRPCPPGTSGDRPPPTLGVRRTPLPQARSTRVDLAPPPRCEGTSGP